MLFFNIRKEADLPLVSKSTIDHGDSLQSSSKIITRFGWYYSYSEILFGMIQQ